MYKDEVALFTCHSAVKSLCPVFTVEPYFTICIHLIILIDGLSKNEHIMIFTYLSVWNKQHTKKKFIFTLAFASLIKISSIGQSNQLHLPSVEQNSSKK